MTVNAVTAILLVYYGSQIRQLALFTIGEMYRLVSQARELQAQMAEKFQVYCEKCNKVTTHTYLPAAAKESLLKCSICDHRKTF